MCRYNVQENVELEREIEQPVVELEQRVELYDFSRPDPLFYNFLEEPGKVYYFDEITPYFNFNDGHYFNEENNHFDEESLYSNHNIDHSNTDGLIYAGEPTISSTSNIPLGSLNYENALNSNGERQIHQCHHQCKYQSKQFYEMKRHWKRKHEDIVEFPTSDKVFTNLANGKRYQCPFKCPHTSKHLRHLRKHKDDKHKD
ncbi:hypothetical protein C2G38_2162562 [Gigaspora rosea]|uniref:Uncharacterized protein n=1 Tax=Gigaspora rosea TaxID=44941 RepID=A0A397VXP8_9GLOM|nr:hypothetical protein C2G38_2162562 [Gigaspora rosea]